MDKSSSVSAVSTYPTEGADYVKNKSKNLQPDKSVKSFINSVFISAYMH